MIISRSKQRVLSFAYNTLYRAFIHDVASKCLVFKILFFISFFWHFITYAYEYTTETLWHGTISYFLLVADCYIYSRIYTHLDETKYHASGVPLQDYKSWTTWNNIFSVLQFVILVDILFVFFAQYTSSAFWMTRVTAMSFNLIAWASFILPIHPGTRVKVKHLDLSIKPFQGN